MYKSDSKNKVEGGEALPVPLATTLEPFGKLIWWEKFNRDIELKEERLSAMWSVVLESSTITRLRDASSDTGSCSCLKFFHLQNLSVLSCKNFEFC